MIIDKVESSNRICHDKEDDGKRKVDEVCNVLVVKDVFEASLHLVEKLPERLDGEDDQ